MIRHRRNLNHLIDLSLPAAEVGTAEGYFASDILSWGVPHLYCVDNWGHLPVNGDGSNPQSWHDKNFNDTKERLKKYGDKVVLLRGISSLMAVQIPDNSLGFVNIDCDHSYAGVRADINAYWPKLVKGGIMAFHDYENSAYGVKRAVAEFCMGIHEIHLLPEDKIEDAGAYLIKT